MAIKLGTSGLPVGARTDTLEWVVGGDVESSRIWYRYRSVPEAGDLTRDVTLQTGAGRGRAGAGLAGAYTVTASLKSLANGTAYVRVFLNGVKRIDFRLVDISGEGNEYLDTFAFSIPAVQVPGAQAPVDAEAELTADVADLGPELSPSVGPQHALRPVTTSVGALTKYRVISPLKFGRRPDGSLVQRQRYVAVRHLSPENVASLTAQGYEIEFVDQSTPESASAPYGPSVLARARDRRPGEARIRWDRQRGSRQRRTIQQIIAERYGGEYERAPAIRAPTRRVVR